MCIIAMIPAGKQITEETLTNMTNNNPHGSGIAWIEEDKIKTYKSMDNKKFIKKAMEIQGKFCKDSDILIHCRIATSGKTNIDNCHPFKISNDTVFAHNGMLDVVEPTDEVSDTRMFNDSLLRQLKPTFLDSVKTRKFIGEVIGSDKLAFLTVNPKLKRNTYIINRDLGEKDNKVWFSNSSYKERTYVMNVSRTFDTGYDWNLKPGYVIEPDYIDEIDNPYMEEKLPSNVFQPYDSQLQHWIAGNYEGIITTAYKTEKVLRKMSKMSGMKLKVLEDMNEQEYVDLYFELYGVEPPIIIEDDYQYDMF